MKQHVNERKNNVNHYGLSTEKIHRNIEQKRNFIFIAAAFHANKGDGILFDKNEFKTDKRR